ncbi:hypothetical protein, partial [Paraclostridium bifermentans]|uniref:hypothetical protein n=1 Tax=Paraclostridium bifermentans TaxID=1490 RepID=UPI00242E661B
MNLFDDIYNSVDSSEDNTIINKIVNEIKKYDVYDVISRISALNLLPQNQNKSILFDTLISSILFETKESYKCDNIMTHNKFRSIIEKLNSTLVTGMIDPNDNIFVQNIMYDDNYMVFNGIDTTPAYNLQMLIDILFYYKNDFPSIFLESAKKLIDMTLKISNSIANKTDADINKKNTDDGRNIILPNSNTINEYAKYITFNEVDFSEYLNNDYELLNDIIISFGNKNIGDIDNRPFYFRPFLRNENNHTLILLNISILPQFTLFKIINIAEKLGIKDKVINRYNDYIWMNCQNYLYTLGHYKIKETQFNIQLEDKLYYKEMIASLYNDKLMLVFFICDDAYKYNENNMFTYYPNDKLIKIFKDRTEYYCSKFQKTNILKNDIVSLVLVHSIGRTMLVGTNKNPSKYQFLSLKPFELQCISINERDNKNFLFRYIRAKNQIISGKYFFSELNLINYYKENKSTFYVSDDFDTTQNTYLAIVGTSCDYIHKAIECEDAIIVPSYTDNNISRIVAFDKFRLIYKEYNIFPIKKIAICILFNNCIIWLTSNEIISEMDKNIYINIIDLISFWLNESRTIIEKIQLKNNLYHFNIMISGNKKSYYVKAEQNADIKLEDNLIIESVDNHYNLIWTPVAYQQLNCIANTREKELCQIILNILNNNSYDNYQNELNNIFSNLLKKKLICLDYIENPSLKPMHYENNRNIHLDDEDILLSLIGKQIIESGEWKYGIIDNKQRTKVANKVVEILYQMLQQKIKELNPTNLIEIIYLDLEEAIYKTLSFQKNYMYNIVCYPENEKKFILDYQNLNKISLALKFMIEYVAAKPPKGDKILSIGEYEYILAICSLIINWAYKNDLFYYNIFNTPIEILKSNRIGIKNSEFLNMSKNIYLS